eukprot:9033191-Alexandrium_andersonii.AAC.1
MPPMTHRSEHPHDRRQLWSKLAMLPKTLPGRSLSQLAQQPNAPLRGSESPNIGASLVRGGCRRRRASSPFQAVKRGCLARRVCWGRISNFDPRVERACGCSDQRMAESSCRSAGAVVWATMA